MLPPVAVEQAKKTEPQNLLSAKLTTPLRIAYEEAAEGVTASVAVVRSAPLEPPATGRLAKVVYGFALPIAVMRALLRDPLERRRFLIQATVRMLVVFAVAAAVAWSGIEATIRLGIFPPGTDFKSKATIFGALVSSMYATLAVIEWIVIAFTHEFDAQAGRQASLRAGIEPEDDEMRPRVRLDTRWIGKRIKRAIRGYRVYIIGIPAISVVLLIPLAGRPLYGLLLGLWSLYWLVVLTASKTAAAWTLEGVAPAPFYLRFWSFVTRRVHGFRWWLPLAYGRTWRSQSEAIFSPCKAVEDAPYPLLGLALCRALLGLPGIYLFLRPFIPVAAAHIIASSRRKDVPSLTETTL